MYQNCNGDYNHLKSVTNGKEFVDGIENDLSLDDDDALKLAQQFWMDVMALQKKGGNDDHIMSFIEYMKLIKSVQRDLSMSSAGIPTTRLLVLCG